MVVQLGFGEDFAVRLALDGARAVLAEADDLLLGRGLEGGHRAHGVGLGALQRRAEQRVVRDGERHCTAASMRLRKKTRKGSCCTYARSAPAAPSCP